MADLAEIGTTGLRRSGGYITEEFLPSLQQVRGTRVWREMSDNDPVIGAMLYAIDKIIGRLEWRIEPFDQEQGSLDKKVFVEECLYDMSDSWDATVSNILSMLSFGFSYHEIVYKQRSGDNKDARKRSKYSDGKIGWRKWPIRSQETLNNWLLDPNGGIQGAVFLDPSTGKRFAIPIDKALLFRTTTVKNNPEGRSLLRNAYRPFYYKRRIEEIEAIGIERDLVGLPVAHVPPEYLSSTATPAQAAVIGRIQEIVTRVKRNEQEGVIFPVVYDEAGHKLFDLTLLNSGGQRQFDTDKVITRYDSRIAMSILSDFILLGHDRVGSFALGSSKIDLWTMAVDAIANSLAEVVNQHAIPRLLRINGMGLENLPYLTYGDVAAVNLTELADFVQKLAASGVLVPDENLEAYLREVGNLPQSGAAT
jgi:hypothetical protein